MAKKKDDNKGKLLSDSDIRDLVTARLSVMPSDTIISVGSAGDFTKSELIKRVEAGDEVGEKIAQAQMAWLRALKEGLV